MDQGNHIVVHWCVSSHHVLRQHAVDPFLGSQSLFLVDQLLQAIEHFLMGFIIKHDKSIELPLKHIYLCFFSRAIRRVVHTSLASSKPSTWLNSSLSSEELRMVMACVLQWIFCNCSRVVSSSSSEKSTPSQTTCHTSGEMEYK
jgi:hypothetical protein